MGTKPLRVVSCFASLAAAVIGLALTAPVAVASPTPDPAPAGVTPTPDPVGKIATPRPAQPSNTRRTPATTTKAHSSNSATGSSQATGSTRAVKTASAPKPPPRKPLAATPPKPTIATPTVVPIATPAGGDRDGDLALGAAIALGALVLASLSLVALTRRMQSGASV